MVTRRGFLGAMLGAAMAPAIVRSENLMKIFVPPEPKILAGRGLTLFTFSIDDFAFERAFDLKEFFLKRSPNFAKLSLEETRQATIKLCKELGMKAPVTTCPTLF